MNKIFKSSVLINLVKNGWILCQPLEEGNPQVFLLDTEVSVRLDHLRGWEIDLKVLDASHHRLLQQNKGLKPFEENLQVSILFLIFFTKLVRNTLNGELASVHKTQIHITLFGNEEMEMVLI